MTIQIHGFAPSTYVQSVRLGALEKGVEYELVPLDFGSDGHRALHPFAKMPVLVVGDTTLFETAAILSYLDGNFAGPLLLPQDAGDRATCWQTISVMLDYGYPCLVRHTLGDDGVAGADADAVGRVLDYLDQRTKVARGTPDIADLFAWPMVRHYVNLAGEGALGNRKRLAAWCRWMGERPSAQRLFGDG